MVIKAPGVIKISKQPGFFMKSLAAFYLSKEWRLWLP
jgi:hypothetical protein